VAWDFAAELRRWGPAGGVCPSRNFARSYCARVARSHYENFTVTSLLLPRKLLSHFHAVYAYCRWADDLADESGGGDTALSLLAWWQRDLQACYDGTPKHPVMIALQQTIRAKAIPPEPFQNLLVAFRQDQTKPVYATFDELLQYCQNSANPVGHLVLHLFDCYDAERAALSDYVCTGLQLANFWQDVARDLTIGRIYIPEEDRRRFGYSPDELHARKMTPEFRELMRFEIERTRDFFHHGKPLLPLIPPRLRVDIDLFIRGGESILNAIERIDHDVWAQRPEVSKREKLRLFAAAILANQDASPYLKFSLSTLLR